MRKLTVLLLAVMACGGGNAETKTNGTTPPPGEVDATAPTTTATQTVPDAGPPHANIDDKREGFMRACLASLDAPDYCSCAFDQFRDAFKDATSAPSEADVAKLKERTLAACGSKIPEEAAKQTVTTSCLGGDERKRPYCECQWKELRKTLQPAEFLGDFKGPKYDDAKKAMSAACKGKYPDEVAKADFIRGCTTSAPAQAKMCECAWKKMRSKGTVEQVVAGLVDLTPAEIEGCKKK